MNPILAKTPQAVLSIAFIYLAACNFAPAWLNSEPAVEPVSVTRVAERAPAGGSARECGSALSESRNAEGADALATCELALPSQTGNDNRHSNRYWHRRG